MGEPIGRAFAGRNRLARRRRCSDFARSELFDRTFQEGMDLVEETGAYLDGAGRQDSKPLVAQRRARLRRREHAADHPADAGRLVAAGAARRARRRHGRRGAPATPATGWPPKRAAAERRRPTELPPRPARSCSTAPSACTSACGTSTGGCTSTGATSEPPHPVLSQLEKLQAALAARRGATRSAPLG